MQCFERDSRDAWKLSGAPMTVSMVLQEVRQRAKYNGHGLMGTYSASVNDNRKIEPKAGCRRGEGEVASSVKPMVGGSCC